MEKRHMDMIFQRAEEFAQTGVTHFKRWELRAWYGAERIGKNVWRNLEEYLQEKAPDAKIQIVEVGDEFLCVEDWRVQSLHGKT